MKERLVEPDLLASEVAISKQKTQLEGKDGRSCS